MDLDDMQIVVLEDLKDFWDDQDVRSLYGDLMKIKFDGYGQVYGENVVSADRVDFFGTHLILCRKGLRLTPLVGYKSVTLSKCEEFNCTLPAIPLIKNDGSQECYESLMQIIETAKAKGEELSFDYSWAQDPGLKALNSSELFRDLIMSMGVNHHLEKQITHMITCGAVKVKTDLFFEKMGLSKVSSSAEFSQKDLNGDRAYLFHTNQFSEYGLSVAERYKDLWDKRIHFSKLQEKGLKMVA